MNEKFFALSSEKQNTILNAGFRVFSKYGYKHASTDEIAREAGISKGLIFHYFGSKREFFLYLFEFAIKFSTERLRMLHDYDKTDLFEIIIDAQLVKIDILHEYPDLSEFLIHGYLEDDYEVEEGVSAQFNAALELSMLGILERIDRSKFKESITAEEALNVVIWMSEGYMKGLAPGDLDDIEAVNQKFLDYAELLRQHFYRKEYL